MNLSERALKLKYDTFAALNAPMAKILPGPVVRIIEEQAAILAELAEAVRQLEKREGDE
jgi:hypothetical protein